MSDINTEVHTVDDHVKEVVDSDVGEIISTAEEAKKAIEAVEETVEEVVETLEETAEEAVKVVEEKVEEVVEALEEKVEEVIDAAQEEAKDAVNEAITEAAVELKEKIDDVKDDVLEALKEKVKDIGVKPSTLTTIIRFTMEAVENTPTKGSEQKDYALRLIKDLIDDFDANDVDNIESDGVAFLRSALDNGSIGDTIDIIVQASRGELDVNTVIEVAATGCLPLCLSLFSKKSNKKSNK